MSHCFCTFQREAEKYETTKLTERKEKGDVGDLPDDPRVRPAADGAVQAHALFLPHGVGAGFYHKLWGVHQAVNVHALKVFLVFMDLKRETPKSQKPQNSQGRASSTAEETRCCSSTKQSARASMRFSRAERVLFI